MQINEIKIKCHACCVWFTPSNERAKQLMKNDGYISLCKECYEGGCED